MISLNIYRMAISCRKTLATLLGVQSSIKPHNDCDEPGAYPKLFDCYWKRGFYVHLEWMLLRWRCSFSVGRRGGMASCISQASSRKLAEAWPSSPLLFLHLYLFLSIRTGTLPSFHPIMSDSKCPLLKFRHVVLRGVSWFAFRLLAQAVTRFDLSTRSAALQ